MTATLSENIAALLSVVEEIRSIDPDPLAEFILEQVRDSYAEHGLPLLPIDEDLVRLAVVKTYSAIISATAMAATTT